MQNYMVKYCCGIRRLELKILVLALLCVSMPFVMAGCGGRYENSTSGANVEESQVDYSMEENWLTIPDKDLAPVDVFYLYPTAWIREEGEEVEFCEIDDERMHAGAKETLVSKASVFQPVANIYAPYYRQIDAKLALSLSPEQRNELLGKLPEADIEAAFDYYIKNLNDGRPFILAGDSQGSNLLLLLLSGYMKENPNVYENMVAAYIIGYSVTEDYLEENPHIHFSEGRGDTGVVISFNTEAPEIEGINPVIIPGAVAINPISWERGGALALKMYSIGARLKEGEAYVDKRHFADARIDLLRGTVICSTINSAEFKVPSPIFGRGIYHTFDYGLYYYDIRQNAQDRVETFLQK
jgi:hypothetical protein